MEQKGVLGDGKDKLSQTQPCAHLRLVIGTVVLDYGDSEVIAKECEGISARVESAISLVAKSGFAAPRQTI